MPYVVPAEITAFARQIGDPWAPWTPFRTTKLSRFDRWVISHDDHFVFAEDPWTLLVSKRDAWVVSSELIDGRTDRRLFLVRECRAGRGKRDEIIYVTNAKGCQIETIRLGHENYVEYRELLTRGGGKDLRALRT